MAAVGIRLRSVGDDVRIASATDATTPADITNTPSASTGQHDPLATATISDVAPNGTATTSTDPTRPAMNGNSTREQRYQELLRSAPPNSPSQVQIPTPPAGSGEKPSFLQRVASAIGLTEKKPTTTPPPAAPAAPRPGQQSPQQNQQQPGRSNDRDPEQPAKAVEEKDPESDTTPPQLLGLQFNPLQVQDGETTTLSIQAQDDLSGIRTISGVIANPTGATVSGFAAQLDPDSNRYIARIVVPKDAAEGNWHIKYLTMADRASNTVNLS